MGHIGLTPQYHNQLGGFKKQGLTKDQQTSILKLAKQAQNIGCFALVLEAIDEHLAKTIALNLSIPCIGIGSGSNCDGQVLVSYDLFGFTKGPSSFNIPQHNGLDFINKCVKSFKEAYS